MSYEKNTWQTGDVVTAEKLNRMEEGIDAASYNPVIENAKSTGGIGWTESGEQVLFDGDLLIQLDPDNDACVSPIDINPLEVGQTYNVKWNGVDYTCECASVSGFIYIGNPSIAGVQIESDEPFIFVNYKDGVAVATMDAGTYSIKVIKNGDTIHKIDSKYLPQSGGTMMVNITFDENSNQYLADKTYDEIMDAIETGVVVKCVIYDEDNGKNVICDLSSYDIRK